MDLSVAWKKGIDDNDIDGNSMTQWYHKLNEFIK